MTLPRTELASERHPMLDRCGTADLVAARADDQREAVAAVLAVIAPLAQVVDAALPRLQAGGRLIYVGAATSGRWGVLDSVELPPTFSWPRDRAVAVLAGGVDAAAAHTVLTRCDRRVKVAIVMLRCHCSADAAQARLLAAGGSVHGALQA